MEDRIKQGIIGTIIFAIGLYLPAWAFNELNLFNQPEWYALPTIILVTLGGLGAIVGGMYLALAAIFPEVEEDE